MAAGTTCMKTAPAALTQPAPAPHTDAPAAPFRLPTVCLGMAAALSGLLLWMCFQPLGWGFLGWVALVPFLVLVRAQVRPWFLYNFAFLCGLAFYVPVLQWMSVADKSMAAAWLALSLYCALYFVAALWCVRRLERARLPLVLSVPLVWAALEYFRSFFLTGFAWYYLGHTQHEYLAMIQITDLGGVYLVSFVVAAVNALIFDIAYQFPEIRRWFNQAPLEPHRTFASLDLLNRSFLEAWLFRRNLLLEAAAVGLVLIGTYAYGLIRLGQTQFEGGPTVCLLQSNLDQRLREIAAAAAADARPAEERISEHFAALCMRASQTRPDLIIWPETSFPRPWVQVAPKLPIENVPAVWRDGEAGIREALKGFADNFGKTHRATHLLGMNAHYLDENGRHLRFNSALLLDKQGRIAGKFDKMHRVPFGEFVPFKDTIDCLSWLTPYEGDFGIQKGDKFTRFELGKHRFGVLVCYEDTDPLLARRYVEKSDDGEPVDFLVNISNDGWFDGSSEHEEHLAVSRFRAIECRRAMVRAVNMGVSAVIDSNGRVLKPREVPGMEPPMWRVTPDVAGGYADLPASEWHQFKKKSGILKAVVPIDRRFSFYAAAGEWLPMGRWLAFLPLIGADSFWVLYPLIGPETFSFLSGADWLPLSCPVILLSTGIWAYRRRKLLAKAA